MGALKKKILLADDDPRVRRLVAVTIGNTHQLMEAGDGLTALELARRERPDLIFLDVNMPGLLGFEVCRRLKSEPGTASIKVVMLTALGTEEDKDQGAKVGADGYFVKPFSPRALLDKLTEILDQG